MGMGREHDALAKIFDAIAVITQPFWLAFAGHAAKASRRYAYERRELDIHRREK